MLLNARKLQAGHHGELLVLAMEDVTPRKRAEEALLKAGALQSAIFNSANFSSIATDEKGVIQIFNVGAERMLGYLTKPFQMEELHARVETHLKLRRLQIEQE